MNRTIIAFGLVLMFFSSCSNSKTKSRKNVENRQDLKQEIQNKESIRNDSRTIRFDSLESATYSFDSFIQKFNSDSVFQLSSIKFPLLNEFINNAGDSILTKKIPKRDWRIINLAFDSTALTRKYDKFYQEIETYTDSVIIHYLGINNGINIKYHFQLIGTEWKLTKYDDFSN